jgi:hypothetical protein
MLGLWDCHLHYFRFGNEYLFDAAARVPLILAGDRGARDVLVTLQAGFTSVRELAGYGVDLSKAIFEGTLVGPNICSSCCAISQTGGHGDAHGTHLDDLLNSLRHELLPL